METTYKTILAIILAMVFTGGCREKQGSEEKLYRLIAAENRELKEQLQIETKKGEDEIKNLKMQLKNEKERLGADIESLTKQLKECRQRTDEKIEEQMKKYCEDAISQLMDWNQNLIAEIERLRDELAKIKGESAGW